LQLLNQDASEADMDEEYVRIALNEALSTSDSDIHVADAS
jgi:hypothetical protein